jgi:hypothetical protein
VSRNYLVEHGAMALDLEKAVKEKGVLLDLLADIPGTAIRRVIEMAERWLCEGRGDAVDFAVVDEVVEWLTEVEAAR